MMTGIFREYGLRWSRLWLVGVLLTGLFPLYNNAAAVTVNVVDATNGPVTVEFRWLLEEDTTTLTVPGLPTNASIGLVIHKSHAPVVATGTATSGTDIPVPDSTKRYFISVLAEGYSLGGASVAAGQTAARVVLNKHKIPTAQITFVAFVDHDQINNALDVTDTRLGGVKIVINDALLGPVEFDAFGNPLGTRYQKNPVTGEYLEDADGNPIIETMGSGRVYTLTQREFDLGGAENPDNLQVGEAVIKNLPPGKYGTIAIPPAVDDSGNPVKWIQTTTIEGTPTIDAWVAADEPAYFVEGFGTGFKHVAQGFIKLSPLGPSVIHGTTVSTLPWNTQWPADGTATVRGWLRYNHFSKPPNNQAYFAGPPVTEGWIGLNDPNAIPGTTPAGLFAMACDPDTGYFEINNLPAGDYQLVTWDKPLDSLFGVNANVPANKATFTVAPGEAVDLGTNLVFRWFGTLQGDVFYDTDEDGFRDPLEVGIELQAVNLRFRNGVMYQATQTLPDGSYMFPEVFPFFKWLITEVDYLRYKPTGMTTVIDDGGPITNAYWPDEGVRNPQPQYETDPLTGVANLAAPVINPNTGDNLSRTEVGPVLTEAIQLFLNQNNRIDWGKIAYKKGENGGISGIAGYQTTRAEEDPYNAAIDPWEPGIPWVQFVLYDDTNWDKVIDDLDADGGVTLADVDNYPLGWATDPLLKGAEDVDHNGNNTFDTGDARQVVWSDSWDDVADEGAKTLGAIQTAPPVIHGKAIIGCDNYSTWNQVRPEVFDGGYAFMDIPAGMYIVQCCPPRGYLIQTEESLNVVFGDAFKPSKLALNPELVGTRQNHGGGAGDAYASSIVPPTRTDPYTVPPVLSLFPGQGVAAPFAGQVRPLADMKWVQVVDKRNVPADFHIYTEVPKAARGVGFVLNDLGAEFNQAGPNFGEKLAAPWLPISLRDWAGTEIGRVYSDEYGTYNFLVPSTYSAHVPMPAGMSLNMITMVLNDPLLPDGQVDTFYNPMYATSPWTFMYSPGGLSYSDTPIVPVAAFTTAEKRIDTEPQDHEPVIKRVDGPETGGGPWIRLTGPGGNGTRQVTIQSMGPTPVINPDYDSNILGSQMNIVRDYGFGTTPGSVTLCGNILTIVSWNSDQVVVGVPANAPSGDLLVTRGDNGLTTQIGVTLHVIDNVPDRIHQVPAEFPTIQAAIDSPLCKAGDLVLVAPGVYNENVIMNKPVKLQGYGAGSTTIYGNPTPVQRLDEWHARIDAMGGPFFATARLRNIFNQNEAPCVLVVGEIPFTTPTGDVGVFNEGHPFSETALSLVDGLLCLGSKAGGGVHVFGEAHGLRVSNNKITGNQGVYAGAVALGSIDVGLALANRNVNVHRNWISRNSGVDGSGGITVFSFSDNYVVDDNVIVGCLTRGNGAAFEHMGYCGGTNSIRRNRVTFNENAYQALLNLLGDGGGLYIGGSGLGGAGAGHVIVNGNLIQGNMTGSGRGAGICVSAFNGQDVVAAPANPNAWFQLQIINNVIVNNVAAYNGGGITIEDAVRVTIAHNTIANNDCTATSSLLHGPGQASLPQGAGIVVHNLSATLAAALGGDFRSPTIFNNIIWHNRSYYFDPTLNNNAGGLAPNPAGPYQDLAVFGTVGALDVTYCLLTEAFLGTGNIIGDPQFMSPYVNTLETATVIDEGGNNVNIRYSPINATGNYHILSSSPAVNKIPTAYLSANERLRSDYDGEWRPYGTASDMGADEYSVETVIARNNFYSMNEGSVLIQTVPGVLGNDSGPGILFAQLTSGPAHGTVVLGPLGSFVYIPAANFWGMDYFSYRARNLASTAYSKEAQVCIRVNPVNDRPVAVNDINIYSINGNPVGGTFSTTIPAPGVLANDTDAEDDPLTAVYVSGPTVIGGPPVPGGAGALTLNSDGSFTFTPNPNLFVGNGFSSRTVDFYYRADDGQLLSLPTTGARVRMTVTRPRPDFVVTGIEILPQPVTTGATMTARVTVMNQGTAAGNGGTLTVWLNQGGADVPAGTAGDATSPIGVLAVGASTIVPFNLTAPPLPPMVGNIQPAVVFRAFVNSTTPQQTEFSLLNNQMTLVYKVVPYGPAFAALPVDNDGIDTDGDGDPNNDFVYANLTGGDGFAKMADGFEIYTFGFADYTISTLAMLYSHPDEIKQAIMRDGMLKAEISAPTIALKEGQRFYLDLSNVGMMMRPDLFDPHTVHFHGFPQAASIFDGEPFASIAVNPGATLRYYYQINHPGTFLYHCHMEATEHMEMGMLGSIYVLPKQNYLTVGTPLANLPPAADGTPRTTHQAGYKYAYNDGDGSTYYDVDYALQLAAFDRFFHEQHIAVQPLPFATLDESYPLINGRGYPDTVNPGAIANASVQERLGLAEPWPSQKLSSLIMGTKGQYILLRLSNVSLSDYHTIRVLGIPMRVVGKDANLLRGPDPDGAGPLVGKHLSYETTSFTFGGGETVDIILDTRNVTPGTYFLYDARLNHLCNDQEDFGGMMTEIIITAP